MTAGELIARAHAAGLTIASQEDGTLRIRGPRAAGPLARELLDRKDEVLLELALTALRDACGDIEILTGTETETPRHDKAGWPPGTIGATANSGDFWD